MSANFLGERKSLFILISKEPLNLIIIKVSTF